MEREVLEHLQEIACFLKTNLKEDDVKTLKDYAKILQLLTGKNFIH